MHIAMVLASRGEGGLEKHVRELSAALVADGHRVTVLADARFLATLELDIGRYAIGMQRSRWHPLLCWQLWRALRQLQPDVVHAHANKATALLATLSRWVSVPCVATLHNLKHQTQMFKRMQAVIAPSHALANSLKHSAMHVVYHGLMLPALSSYYAPARFTLCAVGRLVPAKGLDILLQAVDGLPLTLKIAGEGPARPALMQQSSRLSALTRVEWLGHVQDIPALLSQSSGLVIASRREGFAYVCAEALLCGVPVIASDVPVANEVLSSPWIVPVEDVNALRQAILHVMLSAEDWRQSQAAAFAFARQHFTVSAMAQATLTVYQSVRQPQP